MEAKLVDKGHAVYFIDPLELNLPLLDRMYKEMENPPSKLIDLQNKIKDAEGYLAVTPEYNHSTSAAMKNTLDYFLKEYFFKPSAIVSYSLELSVELTLLNICGLYLPNLELPLYLLHLLSLA